METKYANSDGYFVILCGGDPSIGKTLLLKNIASKSPTNERVYIMVDGRKAGATPNLFTDIIAAFDGNDYISQDLKGRIYDGILKITSKVIGKFLTDKFNEMDISAGAQAIETFFKSEKSRMYIN
jgi:hypothetical protein